MLLPEWNRWERGVYESLDLPTPQRRTDKEGYLDDTRGLKKSLGASVYLLLTKCLSTIKTRYLIENIELNKVQLPFLELTQ